jgi:integrase
MSSKALLETMHDASGCYHPEVLDALWAAIPRRLQTLELRSTALPLEDLAAFVMSANNGRQRGFRLNYAPLRAPLDRELAWCCWRIIELGGRVPVPAVQSLLRWLAVAVGDQPAMRGSLMQHSPREWERAIRAAFAGRQGRLPGPVWVRNTATLLRRCYQLLWAAYDRRPWWRREVWNLALDPRIPRRPHEPAGAQGLYFHQLEPAWLRLGMQWWFKVALETGALTWTTLRSIRSGLQVFADWLGQRGPVPPWLCDDPAEVRVLMLEFLGHVRGLTARSGPNPGKPLSDLRVNDIATNVEQFYLFMHDNREAAARALDEPGWLRLGLQHATLWRRGETRRSAVRPERREVIDDTAFSQIMANLHLLGASAAEGGFGDEQVMRIVMLVARTGRRVSEIRMLDRDPLLPLDRVGGSNQGGDDDGGFVAKLRDQQTKIDRAPDTMLVDAEIVAIIGEQQRWVDEHLSQRWAPRTSPRYLFLAARMNRHADKPYTLERIHLMVGDLARRLGIRDGVGRLVDFNRTHRFRHTRATSLLNAGVPLHVVQRYLGHLTPAMTMEYAETLAETHEREFLRYRKPS